MPLGLGTPNQGDRFPDITVPSAPGWNRLGSLGRRWIAVVEKDHSAWPHPQCTIEYISDDLGKLMQAVDQRNVNRLAAKSFLSTSSEEVIGSFLEKALAWPEILHSWSSRWINRYLPTAHDASECRSVADSNFQVQVGIKPVDLILYVGCLKPVWGHKLGNFVQPRTNVLD
jgi:hypothetical protein